MFDIFQVIPRPATIKIVDVGAMALGGVQDPYAPLLQAGIAKVIGFEPVPEECAKLNAQSRGQHEYLPYAVGDGSARTFNTCNYPMTSSLYEPNTPLLALFQNLEELVRVVKREPIQTRRMDDLPQLADVDLIKLDVQGAELDVIRGGGAVLSQALVVQTEVEFVPLYKDQPLFADVDRALRDAGYTFHKFSGLAGRAFKPVVVNNNINQPLSQVLWADAVYVRDFMRLGELTPAKLLKLAVILHVVFQSFDLAAVALKAYDGQMSTDLSAVYLTRLFGKRPA